MGVGSCAWIGRCISQELAGLLDGEASQGHEGGPFRAGLGEGAVGLDRESGPGKGAPVALVEADRAIR